MEKRDKQRVQVHFVAWKATAMMAKEQCKADGITLSYLLRHCLRNYVAGALNDIGFPVSSRALQLPRQSEVVSQAISDDSKAEVMVDGEAVSDDDLSLEPLSDDYDLSLEPDRSVLDRPGYHSVGLRRRVRKHHER